MWINKRDFEGKTIKSIDTSAVNRVVFCFADGTKAELEAALMSSTAGLWGIAQVEVENLEPIQ